MDHLTQKEGVSYLHPSKRWEYPWALQQAELDENSVILDAGSGASIFPVYLAKRVRYVSALDVDLPQKRIDRLHREKVGYARGFLSALPYLAECFDFIFCISVIEHLPDNDRNATLREFHRVLKPGGKLLITTDFYEDASAEIWYSGPGKEFPVDWNFFDESELRRHILQAPGFTLVGNLDLDLNWQEVKPAMRRFHGYPYTSVGIQLKKIQI